MESGEQPAEVIKGRFIPGVSGKATRFGPGNNANPQGRRRSARYILEHLSDETLDSGKDKKTVMLEGLYEEALKRKPWAIEMILDRLEGKIPQYVETTTNSPWQNLTDEQINLVIGLLENGK